jgi:hypothetical protein
MRARPRILLLGVLALAASAAAPETAPAASTKAVLARLCRRAIDTQGRLYALKRQMTLLTCIDKFLKCELLLEVDGIDPTDCRASVAASCVRRLGDAPDSTMSKAQLRFDTKAAVLCLSPDYTYADILSAGPGGLWYGNDATCGGSIDLPSLLTCVRGELETTVDGIVSVLKPRAGILLDNAGLGGPFPGLTRPPSVDVPVEATAPGSGVLVDPGTINVPVGRTLRFTADFSTLACAGSDNNGRVTLTVGSGPTAQRHVLREPYTDAVAIFGAFTSAGPVPYTIDFKDGSCDSVVSGTVSVP